MCSEINKDVHSLITQWKHGYALQKIVKTNDKILKTVYCIVLSFCLFVFKASIHFPLMPTVVLSGKSIIADGKITQKISGWSQKLNPGLPTPTLQNI